MSIHAAMLHIIETCANEPQGTKAKGAVCEVTGPYMPTVLSRPQAM